MKNLLILLIVMLLALSLNLYGCNALANLGVGKFSLTVLPGNMGGAGDVDPGYGTHSYKAHEAVTVTATPQPGSLFGYWQGDLPNNQTSLVDPTKPASGLDSKIVIKMDHDKTVITNFMQGCKLTINANGPGHITIENLAMYSSGYTGRIDQEQKTFNYYRNQEMTVTAIADQGGTVPTNTPPYSKPDAYFSGWTWTGDASQKNPDPTGPSYIPLDPLAAIMTIRLNGDFTLTANFASSAVPK